MHWFNPSLLLLWIASCERPAPRPATLVLGWLDVRSSWEYRYEEPTDGPTDTVQWWHVDGVTWRVRSFAIDRTAHFHHGREDREFTQRNLHEHFGHVMRRFVVVEFDDLRDAAGVRARLDAEGLPGTVVFSDEGAPMWNAEDIDYGAVIPTEDVAVREFGERTGALRFRVPRAWRESYEDGTVTFAGGRSTVGALRYSLGSRALDPQLSGESTTAVAVLNARRCDALELPNGDAMQESHSVADVSGVTHDVWQWKLHHVVPPATEYVAEFTYRVPSVDAHGDDHERLVRVLRREIGRAKFDPDLGK